ncbi:MAG: hypothetical protein D6698_14805 [Gammaproteobacteria bacterium]|nr:MAG: hypothetical protein D6698_14805 [Gammaproteobacteria bacterium]
MGSDITMIYWGLAILAVVLCILGLITWDDYRTTQYRRTLEDQERDNPEKCQADGDRQKNI